MSLVLFDAPGPRARRRTLIWSVAAAVVLLGLVLLALRHLAEQGIFDGERWDIFVEDGETWNALLRRGLLATLRAAALAAAIAVVLAPLITVARISHSPWLRVPARLWIELFRGLPVILLMFFASLALDFPAFRAVVLGLVLYNSAVLSEILRAGITSLPDGQREAALAVGLRTGQTLRIVLLPQAARRMLPSLISQLVVLLKDTSLGYIVAYAELLRTSRELGIFFGNKYIFSIFFVTAALYIGVNMTLSQVATHLERRGTTKAAGGGPALQVLPDGSAAPGGLAP